MNKLVFFFLAISPSLMAQQSDFSINNKWQNLLDKELSNWELYVGVPHTTVELEGHPKSEDITKGVALGLNNDPKKVMTTSEKNGEVILNITGEIYAGLTSLQEFENYHLKAEFKWGEKKWEPRLDQKRDNGILYHCHGEHGAFWNVWMSSLECQIQEHDMGDFVALVNGRADIYSSKVQNDYFQVTGESDSLIKYGGIGAPGYCHIKEHNENPNGEWNTVEVICHDDKSLHVVNGKVVMVVLNSRRATASGEVKLTKGKIQLQSEGAEAYFKNVQIKAIKRFPKKYKKQTKLLKS